MKQSKSTRARKCGGETMNIKTQLTEGGDLVLVADEQTQQELRTDPTGITNRPNRNYK
jgi:hypothetical protein